MRSAFFPAMACLALLCGLPRTAGAVDTSAANLIAFGEINLSDIQAALAKKYPAQKETYWNISGVAYHDFFGDPESDVLLGLSGYRDKGKVYNNGKQVVEDAGAGFAYYHKAGDRWVLRQVEIVHGTTYEGFEGADLTGSGKDQLVLYSSAGTVRIASLYALQKDGAFKPGAVVTGNGMGPRVARERGHALLVNFEQVLTDSKAEGPVYYGRAYRWSGREFIADSDEFLDCVQDYFSYHDAKKALERIEGYLPKHPKDFCALADGYDLSSRLGFAEKSADYKKRMVRLGADKVLRAFDDSWIMDRDRNNQRLYLEGVLGKKPMRDDPEPADPGDL